MALTKQDAETIMHTGPGTPMGELIRRTWVPFCLSEELREPDCDPIRIRMLSEDLIAFRDSAGKVGVMDEHCPHRGASLFFGRNEEGGIRCLYHGWKMDVGGNILETPCEPADSRMRFHIKHTAYPVVEQGDVVWIYMGPKEKQPPFPNFWWTQVPPDQRVVGKIDYGCNYVQSIEGAIEHIHGDVLHSGHHLMKWTPEQMAGLDQEYYGFQPAARLYEFQNTNYGFRFAGIKPKDDGKKAINITPFVVPFHVLLTTSPHMFVPMDDEHTWYFDVRANANRPVNREQQLRDRGEVIGVDVDANHRKIRTLQNNFMQDRKAMRQKQEHWSYSGFAWGKPHQDMAVIESMGALTNWSKEHLGVADNVILAMRQCLADAVKHYIATGEVPSWDASVPLSEVRGGGAVIPGDSPWQAVSATAGEFEPVLVK